VSAAYTRLLAELRRSDAAEFGGKSANLGELLAAGFPVPSGFAVGANAFRTFVAATGLQGMISAATSRASAGDAESVAAASKTIDEAMRFAPLPEAVRVELLERHEELALAAGEEPPVAVRSSALGEDSHAATHAGQQESFLWVRGVEQICDAVRDCWVSLYTARALSYRATLCAEEKEQAMGVTVQSMVDAEVSGVMFTCNPVSGDPSMVALNASWGLGIAVVGGETTPDDYLVSKITGEVVRHTVSTKDVEYVPDASGRGAVRVEVPAERRDEPCLGEAELAELVDLGRRVERHFGGHQDVEWAIARGQPLPESLLVLQARPVTALKPAPKLSTSALSLVMGTFGASPDRAKPS
jgi:phosphoenolpyruvate synthase/pyruvate phosphate dikinase